MTEALSDAEIDEVNKTIAVLQDDMRAIIGHINRGNFNDAFKTLEQARKHTDCPVCQDKFTLIGAELVKTQTLCKMKDGKCELQKRETLDFTNRVKDTFLPIATEKNAINNKSVANGGNPVYTKENGYTGQSSSDVVINPFTAPIVIMNELLKDLRKS